MTLYYINDADEMELEGVAVAIEEAGFTVGAVRIRQAMEEIKRLKEALAGVSDSTRLLERLAAIEHERWMTWATNLMETERLLSDKRVLRWRGSLMPYAQLTEENKEHDRIWAKKVLEILLPNTT